MKSCNLFLVSLEEGSTGWPGFPGRLNIPTFFFNFFWRFSFSFLICKDSLFQKATFCRPAVMSHILPVHLVLPVILCKPDFRDYLSLQVYSISCLCGFFDDLSFTRSDPGLKDPPLFCCSFLSPLSFGVLGGIPLQLIENKPVEV